MILDLDAFCYNALLRPMIECLRFSSLVNGLTMVEEVPLIHLYKAFSATLYNKLDDGIYFEVSNHKTSISMPHFYKLLGLITPEISVNPELIPAISITGMFFQMGYTGDISLHSKFKKSFFIATVEWVIYPFVQEFIGKGFKLSQCQ
ncbi:unnamed protein product [Lactuca saligna]|uniref:Uncharacterized protein n=1 Tax=Lactuca saligna TaxID=75948 RepID=A0AA35ZVE8_LACSI|nr:unnamed protein product [Lactuca saligna]